MMTSQQKTDLERVAREREKTEAFARVFPFRLKTLKETMRKMQNCSNKSNYAWPEDKVKRAFVGLAIYFVETAKKFGLDLDITINGETVTDKDWYNDPDLFDDLANSQEEVA